MPSASSDREGASVTFEGVWKRFRTGERHDSLRDLIPALLGRATRAVAGERSAAGEFWAVRDVSFSVRPGEALGIIGANGAGKSTVLKLLTRVMRPTHGRVETRGRIGALIEVAAGFHPDLTGRENVFLQGAILGMPTGEVRRKFDAIVEFAGVSEFLDTPVKRYSTGMGARLGFAIAAHLEPDILVTDEVLAVGDFAFQQRAFERLGELAARGVPVILVSHQLSRLASLCTRALVLDHGAIAFEGGAAESVAWYTSRAARATAAPSGDAPIRLDELTIAPAELASGQLLTFRVRGRVLDATRLAEIEPVGLRLRSSGTGRVVSRTSSVRCGLVIDQPGGFAVEGAIQLNVPAGVYLVEVHPWSGRTREPLQQSLVASVHVTEGPSFQGDVQLNARMHARQV